MNHPPSPYESAEYAARYDRRWRRYSSAAARLLCELLAQLPMAPRRILDIGCGTGETLMTLREHFPHASAEGIDPSHAMLEVARGKLGRSVRLLPGTIADAQGGYDLITAVSMFHYVRSPEFWLARARSLVRPGGFLLLIDWNGSAPFLRIRKSRLEARPHIAKVYTTEDVAMLMRDWRILAHSRRSCHFGWWALQGWLVQ